MTIKNLREIRRRVLSGSDTGRSVLSGNHIIRSCALKNEEEKNKSTEDFEKWCEANHWFQDARILRIEPAASDIARTNPSVVTMELAYQIEGNYRAYSRRVSRVFRATAEEIQKCQFPEGGTHTPEHWAEGMDILESDSTIAFEIDLPSILTLECQKIAVEELPNLVETVEPYLSEREVYVEVEKGILPTPSEWLELYERHKLQVSWHRYGDEPSQVEEVPVSNYEGWFLQVPDEIAIERQGVFFFSSKQKHDGFRIQVQNHNCAEKLWMATKVILGKFKNSKIQSGNCEFSGNEWLEELGR